MQLMKKDDRITYVGKQVWIVLSQCKDKSVEVIGAFMDDDKARKMVAMIKGNGGYAWYRDVEIG